MIFSILNIFIQGYSGKMQEEAGEEALGGDGGQSPEARHPLAPAQGA